MAVIDDRGRLFGKVNLIDFALIVFVLVLVPLGYGAYLLFRTPPPRLIAVTPNRLVFKKGEQRVRITGEHLRPFMRATIGKLDARGFLVERRDLAEVVFDDMPVGTYDLALFDFTEEVTRLPNAITIVLPPLPPVQVLGRFVGTSAAAANIAAGSRIGESDHPVEVVSVDPVVRGERTAMLRVSCNDAGPCAVSGTPIEAGKTVAFPPTGAGKPLRFAIDEVRIDGVWAEVQVRLFAIGEALDLMKTGDVDRFQEPQAPNISRIIRGAVVQSLEPSQTSQGTLSLNFSQTLPDIGPYAASVSGTGYVPLKTRAAVLRMPLQHTASGWKYRDQIVRSGGAITFETENYLVHGPILRVVQPAGPRDRTEE